MSTYMAKRGEVEPQWLVVDASDQVLGRLAARLAVVLQGKHKPTYTPHVESGDFVIVVNAEKVRVTGRKADAMEYATYSRYPSGRHVYSYRHMIEHHPEKVIEITVRRMLPKNRLGRQLLTRLKVYRGDAHPHAAQQPRALKLA
jgi:large subunit ribosomal protein L13